ncbi:MAG: alpha-L-fucosidase [Bacteroidetes bacterium]|nr:alpha-L-fucosidase [Bacteroidota bacterium]MBU1116424.1 alpha-L-fucosidase [Bacteroidota bacterium]MBU1800003.1 alpha-L-fucosidase [Bacteroidota bacterium]
MKISIRNFAVAIICFCYIGLNAQSTKKSFNNYVKINSNDTEEIILEKAAKVTPSNRQYEWQKMELTAFIHFGINTFDEVEWGQHETDIKQFNPTNIDVKQWVSVLKNAGMKLIVLTTKHHDGFCLWPSKFTDYDIANTPFKNGDGDIVNDLSKACADAGIKFGVYLSPWDMHEKLYGTDEYNTHFKNQLTELLTNYGEIAEVWFDGANGEGANGKKQIYDWNGYYELIRNLQPNAVIAVMGPDVRWVGTESGYGRKTEWSVLPGNSTYQDDIASGSQQAETNGAFIPQNLMDEDLGSRDKIFKAESLVWYPAEIDVSIRPGWFYNSGDDNLVKTPLKLVDIYYNSVGLNGVLLLNVPPDKRGLIHENDIKSLNGMRYLLDETFNDNFMEKAKTVSSNEAKGHEAKYLVDNSSETYWSQIKTDKQTVAQIILNRGRNFNTVMLQENILEGQRIEKFRLEFYNGQLWETFAEGTTIGYKRLIRFPEVHSDRIKIIIEQSRSNPQLSTVALFKAPPEVSFEPNGCSFGENIKVKLSSDTKRSKIYYTLDGSEPNKKSLLYKDEITLNSTTTITAIAISPDKKQSLPTKVNFNKAKYSVKYNRIYSEKYSASKEFTLVDGVCGAENFTTGDWQGFEGDNLDVVIDLGESKALNKISSNYINDLNSFIFLPSSVEYSFSEDGINYESNLVVTNNEEIKGSKKGIKTFTRDLDGITARYIRVVANNIGTCPDWHKGFGSKAWLFIDEIDVK